MNTLRWCLRWILLFALLAFFLNISSIFIATAQDTVATEITLNAPSQVSLGDTIPLSISLRDAEGTAIGEATVRFFSHATFLAGSTGFMEVGETITDDEGMATYEYLPRRNGNIEIVAEYDGGSSYAPSQASITFVTEGNKQLYEAHIGLNVPFVNVSLLFGVLGMIWAVLLFVGFLIVRIARAPSE